MKTTEIKISELKTGSRLITDCGRKATVTRVIKGLRHPNADRYKMMDLYVVCFDYNGLSDCYGRESIKEKFKMVS